MLVDDVLKKKIRSEATVSLRSVIEVECAKHYINFTTIDCKNIGNKKENLLNERMAAPDPYN